MGVNATQVDSVSGGLPRHVTFTVANSVTVWMLFSASAVSAQDVIDGGFPLHPGMPLVITTDAATESQDDPSQCWLATVSGAGDVRII